MPGNLSSAELGVVAVVILLILRDVLKFLKDVVFRKISGQSSDSARIKQDAINDISLRQLASAMEKQTVILQGLSFVVSAHEKEFHEFIKTYYEHLN
jgi:hypothetical protein